MKPSCNSRARGFTLLETVIAIGVLAVLLTGFMVVFAPAAEGIRKSINVQQADRLASTVEQELVTLRDKETATYKTGFNKSFDWIKDSDKPASAILVYQYRGKIGTTPRSDGTLEPEPLLNGKLPGKDYQVVPVVRRLSDPNFKNDLPAIEGSIYLVKCTQLVFNSGELKLGSPGSIKDPKAGAAAADGDAYPEAVIAFSADFFIMPAKADGYFTSTAFTSKFPDLKNPVFSRNLAVRR
ncbi:MAG: type II secretion system protein [Luteolibacter sp.]|uniref:type IV pilus modification PilV family protein n=1 Tax=Luteolibacter sp. TaxID=1962973 RepID=UPI003266C04D